MTAFKLYNSQVFNLMQSMENRIYILESLLKFQTLFYPLQHYKTVSYK